MGCSLFKRYEVASGLILPDQEMSLTVQESSHPFVGFEVKELFNSFAKSGCQGIISKRKFNRRCKDLGVSFSDSQLAAMSTDADTISLELLLITAVLLGRAEFHNKLDWLLNIYSIDQEDFPVEDMIKVFKDLIHVAVCVIPGMSPQDKDVEFYLFRLRSAESCLLVSLISRFSGFRSINQDVLLQVFELFPDLQKICWANGVRMLLIEEDFKLSANKRAPIKKNHKNELNSASENNNSEQKTTLEGTDEIKISKMCSLCSPPRKFLFK